ncbi:MAG: GNAT family N-acetyltransferase, partial [Pyrinomonadaceae bacterium]
IAILPMISEEKRRLGMRIRRLGFIGEGVGGADHLGMIARGEDISEALAEIYEHLAVDHSRDAVRFEYIDADSSLANKNEVLGFASRRKAVADICPQIDLGAGWDAVLQQSRRASNFKRRVKQIEKLSGYEFRSIIDPAEISAAFERFLVLHERRWAASGGSELSGHPRLIEFQRSLVPQLAAAELIRFDELWFEGTCRGSIYGLDDGRTFYYYNAGYDLESANLSVGLVLLGLSIQAAAKRGVMLYDFLRGDEAYKSDWANRRTELVDVSLHRNARLALADEGIGRAISAAKTFSAGLLPSQATEMLKAWRRAWRRNYQLSGR